jgi:2-amino-4-hydroxy-6-hydroxymethyldihydropteridine diphosphokinase
MSHTAYLSLGSNLGDREAHLREAARRLSEIGTITATSSLYETAPMEVVDQPWFLNAVVALRTDLAPADLLRELLAIEKSMGRVRTRPKGPRTIDLDILLYDDEVVHAPSLTIPHPAMQQRLFVLAPLAEIAPEVVHPVLHRTAIELRDALTSNASAHQQVRQISTPWSSNA